MLSFIIDEIALFVFAFP